MKEKPPVISEKEQDDCTPTNEEVENYLAEPDDEIAANLRASYPEMFKIIGRCLLYGKKIAKAQRDADVAYYEPIIQAEIEGLFETIEAMYPELKQGYWENKNWQSLKDKWLKEAKNGSSIKNATT